MPDSMATVIDHGIDDLVHQALHRSRRKSDHDFAQLVNILSISQAHREGELAHTPGPLLAARVRVRNDLAVRARHLGGNPHSR